MRRFLHDNSLSIVAFGLFVLFWVAMAIAGYMDYNEGQDNHGLPPVAFTSYLGTGHFWEATSENWESEYLQMGLFVLLTALLLQKGSAESKTEEEHAKEQHEEDQEEYIGKTEEGSEDAPWPVRKGGFVKLLYENSLAITLLGLFLVSFVVHAISGAREYSQEQMLLGRAPVDTWGFLSTPKFWFQSFQNWQSEFLAVASMVVLTIYLRQKGSAESKRVGAPARETGTG